MTNHTTALSFACDTTVYAHAPAAEDVANLKGLVVIGERLLQSAK